MTLENFYYVGQTIAVIVVVASLIAILWQGHQTNKIARADALSRGRLARFMTTGFVRRWRRAHRGDGFEQDFQKILGEIVSNAEAASTFAPTPGEQPA